MRRIAVQDAAESTSREYRAVCDGLDRIADVLQYRASQAEGRAGFRRSVLCDKLAQHFLTRPAI